jgi:hypothetical protein
MKQIPIKELIEILQKEQEKGRETLKYKGTLLSNDNSVLLTTEKQF